MIIRIRNYSKLGHRSKKRISIHSGIKNIELFDSKVVLNPRREDERIFQRDKVIMVEIFDSGKWNRFAQVTLDGVQYDKKEM